MPYGMGGKATNDERMDLQEKWGGEACNPGMIWIVVSHPVAKGHID